MYLVDTSVWIDFIRGKQTPVVNQLQQILATEQAGISPVIYQEILQGAASIRHFEKFKSDFSELPF
jgi:hypothetical protein